MTRFKVLKKRKFDRTSRFSYYEGKEECAMKKNTVLNKDLSRLDNIVNEILSYAIIQAAILKYFFKEFKNYSLREIENNVLGAMPGGKITYYNPNIGTDDYMSIIYRTKENGVYTGMYGVDLQGPIDHFVRFAKKMQYHTSVITVSQIDRPIDIYDFGKVIKTFTFWIVTAKYKGYSGIYKLLNGLFLPEVEFSEKKHNISTIGVVYLDYDINSTHTGLRLLNILFSWKLSASRKEALLDEYFDGLNVEIKEKVREMCTYSIGVYNNGFTEGEIKRTVTLMQKYGHEKSEIISEIMDVAGCDKLKANAYYDKYSKK